MANDPKANPAANKANPAAKGNTDIDAIDNPVAAFLGDLPPGFMPLNLSRSMYSPQATQVPLQGYIIAHEEMFSPQLQRKFDAVIVRTTSDTECVDAQKKTFPVKAGADVILVITSSLTKLVGLAGGEKCPEIIIKHAGKKQIGGGKTLNEYVGAMTRPETWPSRATVCPDVLGSASGFDAAQLGGGAATPQLPSGH
jgi:hypothetical protein